MAKPEVFNRALGLLVVLGGLAGAYACTAELASSAGDGRLTGATGAGVGGTSTGDGSGEAGVGGGPLPPEEELEQQFEVPVATGPFVWTANPESNRVALIDARSFEVTTLEAGFRPRFLAALPPGDSERNAAVVINELSHDAHIFTAQSSSNVTSSASLPVHPGANAWAISESGRFAIAWSDARRIEGADPTDGFQDVTVIDLSDPNAPTTTRLNVGYRPTSILVNDSETQAFAVTQPGVSVIELADGEAYVSRDLPIAGDQASEVSVTPDGQFALVRSDGSEKIAIVDLENGEEQQATLPRAVTDLDLARDASFAVAVMRGSFEDNGDGSGAGGGGGDGGQGGDDGNTGDPAFSNSLVAILPIPAIFSDPTAFTLLEVEELFGSVVVPDRGSKVLLYTNAVPSDRLTILDTESHSFRTVLLKAPIRAVFATPDAKHGVALMSPPAGSSRAGAFSLVSIQSALPPKLQGTDAPTQGVALVNSSAVITTRGENKFEAFIASFPSLGSEPLALPSAPTSSGIVEEAGVAFVAQEHPEGRLTFAPLSGGTPRTLTGFELGVKVDDGSD